MIVNSRRDLPYDTEHDHVYYDLGLWELEGWDAQRTKRFVIDCSVGGGQEWNSVCEFVKEVSAKKPHYG